MLNGSNIRLVDAAIQGEQDVKFHPVGRGGKDGFYRRHLVRVVGDANGVSIREAENLLEIRHPSTDDPISSVAPREKVLNGPTVVGCGSLRDVTSRDLQQPRSFEGHQVIATNFMEHGRGADRWYRPVRLQVFHRYRQGEPQESLGVAVSARFDAILGQSDSRSQIGKVEHLGLLNSHLLSVRCKALGDMGG